jgi:hypothetical protein
LNGLKQDGPFCHLKTGHKLCLENDHLKTRLSIFQMVTVFKLNEGIFSCLTGLLGMALKPNSITPKALERQVKGTQPIPNQRRD